MRAVRSPVRAGWILGVTAVLAASGCATYVPLQTASTVAPGRYRVGAQVTGAPYCTLSTDPALCSELPRNTTLPELRLSGRTGLARSLDAGATVHARMAGDSPIAGLSLDGKAEAWSHPLGTGRLLVSGGLGAGGSFGPGSADRPGVTQLEVAVPVFFAYDRPGSEWLFSPRLVQRVRFIDITGDPRREALGASELGFAVGYVSKGSWQWAVQLEYHAPLAVPLRGPLTLSVGMLFDVG